MDSYKELLYVTCLGIGTVLVYNATNFKIIRKFGDTGNYPLCVAASREFVYVGYSDLRLLQFKLSDFSMVNSVSVNIDGVAVNDQNQVFAMRRYGLVRIYDRALILKETLDLQCALDKFTGLNHYNSMNSMSMREDKLYLLFNKRVLSVVSVGDWRSMDFYFKKGEGNNTIQ